MKKSIKYAGIAAATLLTVAPIAAPVVSNATLTTVQADAENADQSDVDKAVTKFGDQFGSQDADDVTLSSDANIALGESNATSISSFMTKAGDIIKTSLGVYALSKTGALKLLNAANQDAQVYVTATDNKTNVTYDGSIGKDVAELNKVKSMDSYLPITFNVYMKYKDLQTDAYTKYAKVATFDLNASKDDELKELNAKFTTPVTVAKNSKVNATQLVNPANVSLLDQNGNSIATQSIKLDSLYYYTYKAAMDNNGSTGVVSTDDISKNDDGSYNEFKTAGTYYQRVQFTAKASSALDSMIAEYQKDPSSYTILVNGKKAESGYDFTLNAGNKTITFVRAINVSDSESEWTVENVDGQVTTKNDASYYTLKNNDNATITNRALQANTAWVTDKVRTDQNGNKQYRVATGEWVNASDVTFSKAGETPAGDGLTDIQKVTGTASLDGGNYVYFLYGKDGKVLTQRSLMPGTDWHVINTAKDSQGNTYYRVATNEWLQQGTGVHFN